MAQILGPYGVKYFSERLTWHVACQIHEMHKVTDIVIFLRFTAYTTKQRMLKCRPATVR